MFTLIQYMFFSPQLPFDLPKQMADMVAGLTKLIFFQEGCYIMLHQFSHFLFELDTTGTQKQTKTQFIYAFNSKRHHQEEV